MGRAGRGLGMDWARVPRVGRRLGGHGLGEGSKGWAKAGQRLGKGCVRVGRAKAWRRLGAGRRRARAGRRLGKGWARVNRGLSEGYSRVERGQRWLGEGRARAGC